MLCGISGNKVDSVTNACHDKDDDDEDDDVYELSSFCGRHSIIFYGKYGKLGKGHQEDKRTSDNEKSEEDVADSKNEK